MEVPSCSEWAINDAMNLFRPNCYVEVGKEGVEAKCKALAMYRGVMRPYLILVAMNIFQVWLQYAAVSGAAAMQRRSKWC